MEVTCLEENGRTLLTSEAGPIYNSKQPTSTDDQISRSNGIIDNVADKSRKQVVSNKAEHFVTFSADKTCKIDDCCIDNQLKCTERSAINGPIKHENQGTRDEQIASSEVTVNEIVGSENGDFVAADAEEIKEHVEPVLNSLSTLVIDDVEDGKEIKFVQYKSEEQLPDLVALITVDLSEPYSIYTYRYFLHNWPHLSHLAYHDKQCVGAIVCKLDIHRKNVLRGYIAMLVVHKNYRRCKIGSSLVKKAVKKMIEHGCEEVVLETEVTNKAALKLYENLGFVRDKRLLRYYLNGVDAWRLKLWLR